MATIGIDIDDTTANTSQELFAYLDKYGENINFNNPLNNKLDIMRGKLSTDELKEFAKKYAKEIFKNAKIKQNATEVIDNLRSNGNKIYIITSRSNRTMGEDITNVTKRWLKENKVIYDELFMDVFYKKDFCIKNNIDVMLDDSIEICEELIDTNTRPILFTSTINKDINTNVTRIDDWLKFEKLMN
jgi:Uncharacterized conserved protein